MCLLLWMVFVICLDSVPAFHATGFYNNAYPDTRIPDEHYNDQPHEVVTIRPVTPYVSRKNATVLFMENGLYNT